MALAKRTLLLFDALVHALDRPHFLEALARRLNLLGLDASFDHVEGVCDYTSNSTSDSSAEYVPEMRILSVPRLDESL